IVASVIRRGYDEFIGKVAEARGKTPAEIDTVAQGRVWSGAQAKERGLVDRLGGLHDAVAAAAARAGLGDHYDVRYVERELNAWQRFLLGFGNSESLAWIVRWSGLRSPLETSIRSELDQVSGVLELLR